MVSGRTTRRGARPLAACARAIPTEQSGGGEESWLCNPASDYGRAGGSEACCAVGREASGQYAPKEQRRRRLGTGNDHSDPHGSGSEPQAPRKGFGSLQRLTASARAKDRHSRHRGSARNRYILPTNTRSRGGFTIHSIPAAARACSLPGNTPTVVPSWSSFRSLTGPSRAYPRG